MAETRPPAAYRFINLGSHGMEEMILTVSATDTVSLRSFNNVATSWIICLSSSGGNDDEGMAME